MSVIKNIKKIGKLLASPGLFFYSIIWLMVLLVVGTVAQKYIGLYQAQHQFFYSFILWAGPVPLPGGFATMAAIFINLSFKLIFASPWSFRNSGTLIIHFGAILLLFGGLLTAAFSKEGSMLIYEKSSSNHFDDYHAREFTVFISSDKGERTVFSVPFKELKVGNEYNIHGTNAQIEVLKFCRNCEMVDRAIKEDDPLYAELQGRAKKYDIKPIKLEKEDETNKSGIVFRLTGAGKEKDGIHFTVDFIESFPFFSLGEEKYTIALRKKRTYLPFEIQLIDFEKKMYPGTETPSSFKSEIYLIDGNTKWRSIIQMNEPLRYKGYTFFQSSYVLGKVEATVFAVVKNVGRMFPYISSIIMCVGLLVHLIINLPLLIKKAEK